MKNVKTIAIVTLALSLIALTAFRVPAFAHEAPHTSHVQTAHHNEHTAGNCVATIADNISIDNICVNPTEDLTVDCQPEADTIYDCPNSVCPNTDCDITTTHQHNGASYAGHHENDGHDHTPEHIQETHHGNRHRRGHH